jgi:integrase
MPKGDRVNLTVERVRKAVCPLEVRDVILWDEEAAGFGLRVYRSGVKRYILQYRAGRGRGAPQRRLLIGDVRAIALADARAIARENLLEVARGGAPARRVERLRLGATLDRYEGSLEARRLVKAGEVMANLRRHLLDAVGDVPIADLDRAVLVETIDKLEQRLPGAATLLRANTRTFMGWAVDSGLVGVNPLAGWRKPRATRAQRLEKPKRFLDDREIPIFWRTAEEAGWPFGPFLQALLLTGQRLVETSYMAWPELKMAERSWTIPAHVAKAGREHLVPLPEPLLEIIRRCPVHRGTPLVFPGLRGKPMTGWGSRLRPVREATAAAGLAHWSPHDLRRTMRTGLSKLGVDRTVSELMLNHEISSDLQRRYDLHEYWKERLEAADRWATHVEALVRPVVKA